MKYLGLLVLAAMATLQLSLAQNVADCTDISIGLGTTPIDPITVPDLPVCVDQRGGPQCCSTEYILDQLNITEQLFTDGLRLELRGRFRAFNNIVNRIRIFVERDLLSTYFTATIGSFSGVRGVNGLVNSLLAQIRTRIDFVPGDDDNDEMPTGAMNETSSGFRVRNLLGNLVSGVATAVGNQFGGLGGGNRERRACIRRVIEGQVQQLTIDVQVEALDQVRRVMASLETLREFISNLTDNLAGFRPLQECIEAVVRLNICPRCTDVRPPLCENVCEAIARACYSPFNDALEDQLEQLWEVVRRIVGAARNATADLNTNKLLLNRTAIISEISSECQISIDITTPRAGRQSDDEDIDIPGVPGLITAAAAVLRGGPFDHDDDDMDLLGICRLLNISSTNCSDGNQTIPVDIPEFIGEDIVAQVNNPVINIDQQTLIDQANSLGTPVTSVINSPAFAEVAPLGLALPETGGPGGPGVPGGSGAASTFITVGSIFLMLLVAVFVV